MSSELAARPAIGFIVEGHGEENCYPCLVSRLLSSGANHFPISRAAGCGDVVSNLEEHLIDITITRSPCHVIVTVDLIDVIDQGMYEDCAALCDDLRQRAANWLLAAPADLRLVNAPKSISIVAQVHKLESWLISDREGLIEAGYLSDSAPEFNDCSEIANPSAYIQMHAARRINVKRQGVAKQIAAALSIERMREHSTSFDKFCREVSSANAAYMAMLIEA